MFTSKVWVFIQFQLVMTVSAPSFMNKNRGSRETRNASLTAFLGCIDTESVFSGLGNRVANTGYNNTSRITARLVDITSEGRYIAATWICTKSFWFLRPAD